MDDDLTHQAQPDELNSECHQQNSKQKSRPIGYSLSFYPLDQQDQADDSSQGEKNRAHQPEEAQWLLGELGQEEERRDVQQTPEIHAGPIYPGPGIARVLGHRHLLDSIALSERHSRDEAVQVAVERKRFRHRTSHHPDATRHIVKALLGYATDDTVKCPRLHPVEPAVQPGRAVRYGHVHPSLYRIQLRPDPLGTHLEIGRQRQNQLAPTPLDSQPQRRGFAKLTGKQEYPDVLLVPGEGDELSR